MSILELRAGGTADIMLPNDYCVNAAAEQKDKCVGKGGLILKP